MEAAETFNKDSKLINTLRDFVNDNDKIVGALSDTPAVILQNHGLLEKYDEVTCSPAFKGIVG